MFLSLFLFLFLFLAPRRQLVHFCCLPCSAAESQVCVCECGCTCVRAAQKAPIQRPKCVFLRCCCLLRVSCPFFLPLPRSLVLCSFSWRFFCARFVVVVVFVRRITARVFRIRLLFELSCEQQQQQQQLAEHGT